MMNRRHFLGTSLAAGAGAFAGTRSASAKEESSTGSSNDAPPSTEWARNQQNVPVSEHGALRERNAVLRAKDPRPNILFIYTDQQTLNALSCAGNPWVRTPNMDALARDGVRFERSYCPAPICGPSRGSLVYGRMPHETGVRYNGEAPHVDLPNLGTALRDAGYDTTWMGKWHLNDSYPNESEIPGFHYMRHPEDIQGSFLGDAVDMHYGFVAGRTLRWHAGLSAKPWFLGVSLHNPHDICHYFLSDYVGMSEADPKNAAGVPLPPLPENHAMPVDEPELLRNRRAQKVYGSEMGQHGTDLSDTHWRTYLQTYYHMTQSVDRCLTPILQGLEAGGWADNTLIIFTSDHGEGMAAHKWFTKLSLYEETLNVPFIAIAPGDYKKAKGRIDKTHLISGLDLIPTCLDYANVAETDRPKDLRGRSIKPILDGGNSSWREYVVVPIDFSPKRPDETGRALVTAEGWKYCAYSKGEYPETLFNLNDDPGEQDNLVSKAPEQLARLRGLLQQHATETEDPFRLPAAGR